MAINLNQFVRRQQIAEELGISTATLLRYLNSLSGDERERLMASGYKARTYLSPEAARFILELYGWEK
jgi:predicted ArsR family transcriptional regulator